MRILSLAILVSSISLVACTKQSDSVNVGKDQPKTEFEYRQLMPDGGKLVDEEHGAEEWLAVGPMSGVEETPANGVVQAHFFDDGTYQCGMQLNIARVEDTTFYEGWLVNPETGDMISIGHLTSLFGDVRHAVSFTSEQDLRGYTNVVVTLEQDDGNPAPAGHVAEGVLKQVQR